MTKPTLAVVGHGMVGHHFLEQCVSRNLHMQYHIVVFGEERYAAYDRVHLSEYFAGRSAQSLSLVDEDFFARHGIELRLAQCVTQIDREARVIRTASGHETHWDALVLATGSYPFVPPVKAVIPRIVLFTVRSTISMPLQKKRKMPGVGW